MDRTLNNFVGSFLEEGTREALKRLEFSVSRHKVSEEGIDVKATLKINDKTKLVSECLNWNEKSYVNQDRLKSLIKNFDQYPDAIKLLIVSHNLVSKRQREIFERHGVRILVIGEQLFDSSKEEVLLVLWKLYNFLRDVGVLQLDELCFLENDLLVFSGYSDLQTELEDEIVLDANTFKVIETHEKKESKPNSLKVAIKGKRTLEKIERMFPNRNYSRKGEGDEKKMQNLCLTRTGQNSDRETS